MSTQDSLYSMHPSAPGLFNNSTNTNVHLLNEFSSEFDPQKASAGKLNGLSNGSLSKEQFTNFPNTNRPRHQNSQSLLNSTAPPFREPGTFFPNSNNDIYPSSLMSPTSGHMQPHDPRIGFDFSRVQGLGAGHKNFQDPFTNSGGVMPSHQGINKAGFTQPPQSQFTPATSYMNGMHSQTPYGPHVPTNLTQSSSGPAGNNSTSASYGATKDSNNNQEEISTIFVVGFPEDMQEREFQNMFTFSPGFEAATLKIPNKEYTAYNGMAPNRPFPSYNGSSDPYNLMTINSGGVLVDGREGTMASWPASMPGDDGNPHFMPGIAPPRKQIIGFAKFRSREAALEARDVLQGRRIDIEKGAVLKAEMAKKNLHTKRGVGPLPNTSVTTNGNNLSVNNPPPVNHSAPLPMNPGPNYNANGIFGGHSNPLSGEAFSAPPTEQFFPREREPLAPVGRLWREPIQPEVPSNVNLSHLASPTSRDQEEDARRREVTLKLDIGPASSLGSSPSLGNGFGSFTSQTSQSADVDETPGPWDRINRPIPPRPRSGSQRSSSPSLPASNISQFELHQSLPLNGPTPKNDDSPSSSRQGAAEDASVSSGHVQSPDSDLAQKIDSLALNTANGNTSPQLPSPASGASSGSTRNAVDQNPPINTLYVGNLPTSPPPIGMPQDYLEESLRELFRNQPGYRRLCFRQKHNGPMCFVEFEDVGAATRAMSDLHGNNLKGLVKGGGIRLSYSKNPLGVRTPTSATSNGPALQQQQLQNMQAVLSAEADSSHQQHRTILRREDPNSPGNTYNNFLASPPPRFLPPQQNGAGYFGPSSPPPTSNNFIRPTNSGLNAFSYSLAATNGIAGSSISPTPFSPFGLKDQHDSSIPEQSSASEEALHQQ
ncbi:Protein WHI3 [Leucoagaricus sp. SymC.cos]|nr:Protein WHI3 [Leucoagaricus sp. SymC.cos]